MEKKIMSFNSIVSDYSVVNPEFARVKVYVCYAGKNRNRSEISKEVLDKMSQSIYGVPVVAEYDKDNNCFKGHGGKLEITDDSIEFVQTTVPYGFVDPTTPVFYEDVTELDGVTVNSYLCCYAYLWYKRYPEVESVLKNQDNQKIGQSMEIEVSDYSWSEDDYCVIKDGHFSGLALLGVEPCFESAKITSKFSKEDINEEYQNMLKAFKKYTLENFEEGEENMDDNNEKGLEGKQEFELSFDEIRERIRNSVKTEDSYCWVVQTYSDHFIYEEETYKDDNYEVKFYKQGYSLENNEVKLSEDKVEVFARFVTQEEMDKLEQEKAEYEANLNNLKAEFTDLKSELETAMEEYNLLSTETNELRQFKNEIEFEKHKCEVDSKLEAYSELETVEGYSELVKDKYTCNIEELEKAIKCFAFDNGKVLTKKNAKKNFSKDGIKLPVVGKERDEVKDSAWDILDKYIPKN